MGAVDALKIVKPQDTCFGLAVKILRMKYYLMPACRDYVLSAAAPEIFFRPRRFTATYGTFYHRAPFRKLNVMLKIASPK
ncbi:MAG: hypothetical protein CMC08_06665 [Flavobacteriaceae bacterium]|nr:hypothetical protein [Flavobacteriaceae bacterium]